jgi:Tol biopolymer transport system component
VLDFQVRNDVGYVYAIHPDGSGEHRLWDVPGMIAEWSPTGGRVAVFRDNDLYVMNADGSHPVNITNGYELTIEGPVWSQDGRYLAYHGADWGAIRVASVEHPERPHRTIAHTPAPESHLDWSPD